ncbi:MAG TPA: hypothetical protein VMS02_03115, partial [Solirubrobacteraceae bacterium]|nr:hypothetical protein [Solirubrobacteraceae bacterium]
GLQAVVAWYRALAAGQDMRAFSVGQLEFFQQPQSPREQFQESRARRGELQESPSRRLPDRVAGLERETRERSRIPLPARD